MRFQLKTLLVLIVPQVHGSPLRLRVENQLVFKMVKWIKAIEFVGDIRSVGEGEGSYNEDHEYFGELANV
jgi:DMSO/TMAO reductase YedYZ molybdopterin-dependent catalytic subunit